MTAGEIADIIGCSVAGDRSIEIRGLAYASKAAGGMLAVISQFGEIERTAADAVLCVPHLSLSGKTMLLVRGGVYPAMMKIVRAMIRRGIYEDWSDAGELTAHRGGYFISPDAEIGADVRIAPCTVIERGVKIGRGSSIGANVHIRAGSVIGECADIASGAVIGADALFHVRHGGRLENFIGVGRAVIGDDVRIGCGTIVQRGTLGNTVIGGGSAVGNQVDIGHDVTIGSGVRIISQCGLAGCSSVGDGSVLMGKSAVIGGVSVGCGVTVKVCAIVTKDVRDGAVIYGQHGREMRGEMKFQARLRRLADRAGERGGEHNIN